MSEDTLAELTRRFSELGAADPADWASSQIDEGIPQIARFVFLREAWRRIVAEDDSAWIDDEISRAERFSGEPYAGVGIALRRLRKLGASDHDITDVVRGLQARLLFDLCYLLADSTVVTDQAAEGLGWALVQITEDGEVIGEIPALHESVLETDPTGREMRPRSDA